MPCRIVRMRSGNAYFCSSLLNHCHYKVQAILQKILSDSNALGAASGADLGNVTAVENTIRIIESKLKDFETTSRT